MLTVEPGQTQRSEDRFGHGRNVAAGEATCVRGIGRVGAAGVVQPRRPGADAAGVWVPDAPQPLPDPARNRRAGAPRTRRPGARGRRAVHLADAAGLAALYDAQLGTEIDLAELFSIAARIQARYREDGYLFTRVVVPAQRIDGGRARLEVVEAVITKVAIEAPELPIGPVRALAEQFAAPLQGLRNPTLEQLERVLLQLNDIPGVTRAAAVPKVGADERGAIELYINMEREAFSVTAFADNRQSPILGPGLVGLVGSFNSWSAVTLMV